MKKKLSRTGAGLCFVLFFISCCLSSQITIIGSKVNDELIFPNQIEEGPDGNIYISDAYDSSIKVYLPSGNFLRTISRKGEGPGEMKRMGYFGFSPSGHQLFFTEFFGGHQWITFMDLTGHFASVYKLRLSGLYGILKSVMISKNQFICEIHTMKENSIQKKSEYYTYSYPIHLASLNEQGKIQNPILKQNLVSGISLINNGAEISIPFKPHFLWDFFDHQIFFSDGLSTKLEKFDLKGNKVGEITIELPDADAVNEKDIDIWKKNIKEKFKYRDRDWFQQFGQVVNRYKKSIYNRKPIFDQLNISPDGYIFLFKRRARDKTLSNGWLVDRKGIIMLNFNTRCSEIKFSKNYLFFRTTDEEENNTLGFSKRSSNAKEDLLKFLENIRNQ